MQTRLLLAAIVLASTVANAQEATRKSQLGVVTQYIAGTKVEIAYRRPVARGRALFGALVPYGKMWTPSADSAARLTISAPIQINGATLPAGSYSLWATPDSANWALSFHPDPVRFHLNVPGGGFVLTAHAKPEKGDYVETLLFSFPMIDADSARLELHWGATVVPFSIKAVH